MKKEFKVLSVRSFEFNGLTYKRRFRVVEQNFASAKVVDVFTGSYLGTFYISDVKVNGKLIASWSELENVVYNFECVCAGDDTGELVGRYFDDTIEQTFE